jgi:hypothetical protein
MGMTQNKRTEMVSVMLARIWCDPHGSLRSQLTFAALCSEHLSEIRASRNIYWVSEYRKPKVSQETVWVNFRYTGTECPPVPVGHTDAAHTPQPDVIFMPLAHI